MKTFLSIGSGPGIGIFNRGTLRQGGLPHRSHLARYGKTVRARRAHEGQGLRGGDQSCDAGDLDSVAAVIKETEEQFGTVDVMHYNSASLRASTIEDSGPQDLRFGSGCEHRRRR